MKMGSKSIQKYMDKNHIIKTTAHNAASGGDE